MFASFREHEAFKEEEKKKVDGPPKQVWKQVEGNFLKRIRIVKRFFSKNQDDHPWAALNVTNER